LRAGAAERSPDETVSLPGSRSPLS
jgi:hypothetical protein